jgi:hypothetical protein
MVNDELSIMLNLFLIFLIETPYRKRATGEPRLSARDCCRKDRVAQRF